MPAVVHPSSSDRMVLLVFLLELGVVVIEIVRRLGPDAPEAVERRRTDRAISRAFFAVSSDRGRWLPSAKAMARSRHSRARRRSHASGPLSISSLPTRNWKNGVVGELSSGFGRESGQDQRKRAAAGRAGGVFRTLFLPRGLVPMIRNSRTWRRSCALPFHALATAEKLAEPRQVTGRGPDNPPHRPGGRPSCGTSRPPPRCGGASSIRPASGCSNSSATAFGRA